MPGNAEENDKRSQEARFAYHEAIELLNFFFLKKARD